MTRLTLIFLTCFFLTGFAFGDGESNYWDGCTSLKSSIPISTLNALANDASTNRTVRAKAIFTLFANYVKAGCSAEDIKRVLTDTRWLKKSHVEAIQNLDGWIPLGFTGHETWVCIELFPLKWDPPYDQWLIYFSMTGRGRSDQEAWAFLRGDTTLADSPKMIEFALCFPYGKRFERFSTRGIHICHAGDDSVSHDLRWQ